MSLNIIQSNIKRTVAIAAGKGGVGKSTFTVLLAAALQRMKEKIGILDADLYGPSIRQMLSEQRLPSTHDGKIIPAVANGMKMLSYAFFSKETAIRAPVANRLLMQFIEGVFWGELDWLLIDFPPGTGDIPLTVAQKAHLSGAIVITTPQKLALLDVRKAIEMFRKVNVPLIGIVENMSYFREETPFGSGGGEQLAEELGIPFLGKIPLDPEISERGDAGSLSELSFPFIDIIAQNMKERFEKEDQDSLSISLVNHTSLKITWEDGSISEFSPTFLQQNCPCAGCVPSKRVLEGVTFLGFEKIGRYGLRFDFSSGCSYGIYPFDFLKELEKCHV